MEVDTTDVDAFINCVRYLGPTFGGINLEDIKAPDCFIIEQRLREMMDIPVFHDDQHGTAIISAAGVINAPHLTGRKLSDIKVVVNGAGAAGIACLELLKAMGLPSGNRDPVRHQGRHLSRPHQRHESVEVGACRRHQGAHTEPKRWSAPIVFLGLSAKGAVTAGHGEDHGKGADHLRHGQSRSRNHAGRGEGRQSRCHRRHRPLATIPIRSTTFWAFLISSAARSTCARARSTKR